MFNNKKGELEDILTAPLMVSFLVLLVGIFIMFIASVNTAIQDNDNIPIDAKVISAEMNDINSSKLYYIPILFVIGTFLFTIGVAFLRQDISDPLFILSFLVLLFYNIIIGVFKLFYLKIVEINFITAIIDYMPGVQFYMDYLFIFQTIWFLIYIIIWGIRR